jgi:tetratricopeptide (TPR) repeat protein
LAAQAGRAFAKFLDRPDCGDEERLQSNALSGVAQAFEALGQHQDSEHYYRLALRGYWGLGDYQAIIKTQSMLASLLLQKGELLEVERLLDHALFLAERENDHCGAALSRLVMARFQEARREFAEAHESFTAALGNAARAGDVMARGGITSGVCAHRPAHISRLKS